MKAGIETRDMMHTGMNKLTDEPSVANPGFTTIREKMKNSGEDFNHNFAQKIQIRSLQPTTKDSSVKEIEGNKQQISIQTLPQSITKKQDEFGIFKKTIISTPAKKPGKLGGLPL